MVSGLGSDEMMAVCVLWVRVHSRGEAGHLSCIICHNPSVCKSVIFTRVVRSSVASSASRLKRLGLDEKRNAEKRIVKATGSGRSRD